MELEIDVAVIGASSAGLFAAKLLAERGISVAVFERLPSFADLQRTLIVTSALRKEIEIPDSQIMNEIATIVIDAGMGEVPISFQEPDLVIERQHLIKLLSEQAQQAGVKVFLHHQFHGYDADE